MTATHSLKRSEGGNAGSSGAPTNAASSLFQIRGPLEADFRAATGVPAQSKVTYYVEANDKAGADALNARDGDAIVPVTMTSKAQVPPAMLGAKGRAILQGIEIASQDLLNSGGAFTLEQVRKILGNVSRQRVDARVKEFSLLAVPAENNRRMFPVAQFDSDGTVLPGLQKVMTALPTKNCWAILHFLVQPSDALGGETPATCLGRGEIDRVVGAAKEMGK